MSEPIRMHPNGSEQVRMGPNTSKNLQTILETFKNILKHSQNIICFQKKTKKYVISREPRLHNKKIAISDMLNQQALTVFTAKRCCTTRRFDGNEERESTLYRHQ